METGVKKGRRPGSLARFKCACGKIELVRGGNKRFLCQECSSKKGFEASRYTYRCCANVHKAIKDGLLKPAKYFACVDCGKPAIEYDHRDYNNPLQVEPVCRSCNLKRGPAIPKRGFFEQAIRQGVAPYRQKTKALKLFDTLGLPKDILDGCPARLDISHWQKIWPEIQTRFV